MSTTARTPVNPFIGSLSRVVWQWVRQEIHAEVVAAGYDLLNPSHVGVFRNPGPDGMRPSALADEMQITKQSVNELLGYLERSGYLVREPDPTDSRGRLIRLTDLGLQLQDVVWQAAANAERKAAAIIGEDRMDDLRGILTDLVTQLPLTGNGPDRPPPTSP
jgi:DNA-binding MarR family transcriptional regulator